MRVALVYDMDACRGPTGVTRHALAQVDRLRARPEIDLRVVSGRITEPDGLAYWESLGDLPRRELPLRTRNAPRGGRGQPAAPVAGGAGPRAGGGAPAAYAP